MSLELFEGPEKKVELVVAAGHPPLRALGDERWKRVALAAQAEILSKASTDAFDAYLLSESSLFVYDDRFTIITCGRTKIAEAVVEALGFIRPEDVACMVLERKNENFPREQPTSFLDDARRVSQLLPGRALRFGDQHTHCIEVFHTERPYTPPPNDLTLEVLMHDIAGKSLAFQGCGDAARATGVCDLLPGFKIDDHVFSPKGYSLNALKDDRYYTLHVTPQAVGSYVSFETNWDFRPDPSALVSRLVATLGPESFDVFAFTPEREHLAIEVPGYRLRRRVYQEVCGFGVTFLHLYRPPAEPMGAYPLPLG